MLPLPLYLLRVLDLSQSVAGGYATRVLADMGAEVIKLETPPAEGRQIDAEFFASLHRNKLSLSIDLEQPAGGDLILSLVKASNLVVVDQGGEGLPGVRIDAGSVHAANPGASFISIRADGSADAGIAAAAAALAALFHHRATGDGQEVVIEKPSLEGNRIAADGEPLPPPLSGTRESPGLEAVVADPELIKRGFFEPVSSLDGVQRVTDGSPYRFSRSPLKVRLPAPGLGEHNAYVLGEVLGLAPEEIRALES